MERRTEEILKDAATLHEYLRTYGALKDQDKPLVVSGILLALDDKFFNIDSLLGEKNTTDGQLIYDAIQRRCKINPYSFDFSSFCFNISPFSDDLSKTIDYAFYNTFHICLESQLFF